jgi:hypothetical protein
MRERQSYSFLFMYFFLFFLPLFFCERESYRFLYSYFRFFARYRVRERERARERAPAFLVAVSLRDRGEKKSARGETSRSIPPEDCNKEGEGGKARGDGKGGKQGERKARGEAHTWLIMGEVHRLGTHEALCDKLGG